MIISQEAKNKLLTMSESDRQIAKDFIKCVHFCKTLDEKVMKVLIAMPEYEQKLKLLEFRNWRLGVINGTLAKLAEEKARLEAINDGTREDTVGGIS